MSSASNYEYMFLDSSASKGLQHGGCKLGFYGWRVLRYKSSII